LILGLNGYIWISKHVQDNEKEGEEGFDAEAVYSNQNDVRFYCDLCSLVNIDSGQDIDDATRTAIARVSNIIRVLASRSVPITDTVVLEAYEWAVEQDSDVKDLLLGEVADALIAAVTNKELTEQW
jgi:exosome complex component RRP4